MDRIVDLLVGLYLATDMDRLGNMSNRLGNAGLRLSRAATYGLIAYALLCNQTYYQFSYFMMSIAVFGLAMVSGMRWVANFMLCLFVVATLFPQSMERLAIMASQVQF